MSFVVSEEDYLAHYGVLRKSGRYPWGSGETQSERNRTFLSMVDDLKRQGMSDVDIVKGLGLESTTQLRAAKSIAKSEEKAAQIATAQKLKDKGMSTSAIGRQMGINESSVRSLLTPGASDKAQILDSTVEFLKSQVDSKQYLDVGTGTEYYVGSGVARGRMDNAIAKLKEQGYELIPMQIDQQGTGNKTNLKILAPPGTTYKDIASDKSKIQTITGYSEDGGRHFTGILPPMNVSPNRIKINYKEDKGDEADGVIYVRPGVKDVSLGGKNYAQVRIAVGGSHYLKGMAMYKDDLPNGVDLVFNTNKAKADIGTDKLAAMKKMQKDPFTGDVDLANPFGSSISRQIGDIDLSTGRVKKLTSAMNIVNEEGDWDRWSRNLSSQMLSKQSPQLAKQQLDVALENKKADLADILQLTNPAVKNKLLRTFSDGADSSAVLLKAAALPRTQSHVILPMNSLKPSEVYAPNYNNGERVALVRYPHGGKFEIPELVVNNRNSAAKKALGQARDAIGIHSDVAKRLSGADFDGDTVLVIPNAKGRIKSEPALHKLKDFDPQAAYPEYPGMKRMTAHGKGTEMGKVSNLITDMTIRGASNEELSRAVRHSMVVIDAEKHGLNYRQSAKDNGISQLMKKYQGSSQGGASTLISARKGRQDVLARKNTPIIDKDTGKLIWRETGENWIDKKTGERVFKTQKSQKLKETDDAFTLSSGTKMEAVYARHSNDLKALANKARYELVRLPPIQQSASAKKAYAQEVESLNAKLALAMRNRPRERQAQILANAKVQAVRDASPDMDETQLKKLRGQALAEARHRAGTDKSTIEITPREWQAIQSGALSNNKVSDILDNADIDKVRQLAMPRTPRGMTAAKESRAKSMLALGYTQAEIADNLGVSLSTVKSIF
jgi:DNA-binding CsgD family transcriptional regulator